MNATGRLMSLWTAWANGAKWKQPCKPCLWHSPLGTIEVGYVMEEPGQKFVELFWVWPEGALQAAHAFGERAGKGVYQKETNSWTLSRAPHTFCHLP